MKIVETILILAILTTSCRQSDKKVSRFDSLPKSDTTCLKELEKAKKDFKKGKLIYCNYSQFPRLRCEKEMTQLLEQYNILFNNEYASDVIIEGQTDGCYCDYMQEQIENQHGKKFIDSLLYIADSVYISNNLDKIYDYVDWDKPPVFPGDKKLDPTNHSGLQTEFEKLVRYPNNYQYKTDSNSMAMVKIYLDLDEFGNAKADIAEFIFWNFKTKKGDFNTETYKPFEKIILSLIEKTKWTPAKIKSFNIKSKSEIFIYLK
jgi:hypothetical protein